MTIKITPGLVLALPLLLLLTWLSFHAVNSGAEAYDSALKELDRFASVESALRRDVLTARLGLLHNYDPLVEEVGTLVRIVRQLRQIWLEVGRMAGELDPVNHSVRQQAELVEQFKTDDALLQNSLAYFAMLSPSLSRMERGGKLQAGVGELAVSMLRLTLDSSPPVAREVEDRLRKLSAEIGNEAQPELRALLAHGQLLKQLLPSIDLIVRALIEVPSRQQQANLRAIIVERQLQSREEARRYRLMLYATSVGLVAALLHLGLQLQSRAQTLQRRAALEHLIADISMRFINAQSQEVGAQIEEALSGLGQQLRADRAYFLRAGQDGHALAWSRYPEPLPSGWPERALTLAASPIFGGDDLVHLPHVAQLPPGPERTLFDAAGTREWVCMFRAAGEGESELLGLDWSSSWLDLQTEERALLRMTFDIFSNAVARERLERDRAQFASRLQHARRMETIGTLTSGIAHNFNNIIGAILGYAELAEARDATDNSSNKYIGEIRSAGERARDLIDQILAFGRRRESRHGPIRVESLLAECLSLLEVSLPATIKLELRVAVPSATVLGHSAQLQQVILNLGNNAAQAMGGDGLIEFRVDIREVDPRPRQFTDPVPAGRYICISVEDSGHGMDEVTLEQIFEPFFTTRPAGNGLGLATVREIVREHGGALAVWSERDRGTRFEVWLPFADENAESIGVCGPEICFGSGETIMVVDPSPRSLLGNEELLAALGYEPAGFTEVGQARLACERAPGRFAAVVLTHTALLASVLGMFAVRRVPVVLAVGRSANVETDASGLAGISEIVSWPLSASELAIALHRCLRESGTRSGRYGDWRAHPMRNENKTCA